jgi:hypothetical protein
VARWSSGNGEAVVCRDVLNTPGLANGYYWRT